MFARPNFRTLSALIGLVAVNACAPIAGPGQVATHVIAPPWKNAYVFQTENAFCTRIANGYVRVFVECMEQRGNRVELFGSGGIPMNVASLPSPPSPPMLPSAPQQRYQQTTTPEIPVPAPSAESVKFSRVLDRLVSEDSRSWAVNTYDHGSMNNAQVEQWANGKPILIKGYYTYDNGKPGWVEAKLVNGRLSCVSYWDFPENCRQLGQGLGTQLEAAEAEEERNQRLHPNEHSAASQSNAPSWFTCHYVYSGSPMIAGMAGCSPW
jgi:hypothetical protein